MSNRKYSVSSAGSHYSEYSAGDSVFSHGSAMSTSSMSTVDPGPHYQPAHGHGHGHGHGVLPCEFVGYSGCDHTFALDDVENWIEHIVSDHLMGQLPDKVVCWFCDHFLFDSARVGSRTLNFQQRMWHIRGHFLEGNGATHGIRPDYYFNEHLWHYGLITDESHNYVQKWNEVPQGSWILPHDAPAPGRHSRSSRHQAEYSNPHDEERNYRRQHKKKSKK